MLANLLKTVANKRYTYELTRQLCTRSENITDKRRSAKEQEEDDLKIGVHLFEQSAIKYEPVSAEKLRKIKAQKSSKKNNTTAIKTTKSLAAPKKTRLERESETKVIRDTELGLEFTKLGMNDPRLSTLLITARSKKRRDKNHQIIVEGRRLILEALACGLKLNSIIFSKKDQLADIKDEVVEALKLYPSEIYKVPHHDLKTWSTLTTPPGIMTVFERPSLEYITNKLSGSSPPLPVTVVCDNIREPNNLGSIIRTCAALPCYQIVITKGCCDPWESKSLRGGCGGHFRVPIRDDVDWQDVPSVIPPEMANDCCVFIAENNWKKLENNSTWVMDYSEIERAGSHNVVVIGGESHGVSAEAYRFLSTVGSRGKCLYIPLAEGVDSLNVASALTLILYELRKSILKPMTEEITSPSKIIQ